MDSRVRLYLIVAFCVGLACGIVLFQVIDRSAPSRPPVVSSQVTSTSTVVTSTTDTVQACDPDPFQILEPNVGTDVTFPLTVRVRVENQKNTSCRWTLFEGQAGTVKLRDATGKIYSQTPLMTSDNWMTDGPVDFSALVPVPKNAPTDLELVFEAEDPSGMGQERTMVLAIKQATACSMKPETGPCKASIKRYYFNKLTGTCESFTWGGCKGSVPFQTLGACQSTCVQK